MKQIPLIFHFKLGRELVQGFVNLATFPQSCFLRPQARGYDELILHHLPQFDKAEDPLKVHPGEWKVFNASSIVTRFWISEKQKPTLRRVRHQKEESSDALQTCQI